MWLRAGGVQGHGARLRGPGRHTIAMSLVPTLPLIA